MNSRAEAGRAAEDAAAELLRAKGLIIVERNFRAKVGEIDLVARDKDEIVFVEVRARASSSFGGVAKSSCSSWISVRLGASTSSSPPNSGGVSRTMVRPPPF